MHLRPTVGDFLSFYRLSVHGAQDARSIIPKTMASTHFGRLRPS